MKLAVDVDYHGENAIAAGILFSNWSDKETVKEYVVKIKGINEYIPGQFYRRELPCILSIIEKVDFKQVLHERPVFHNCYLAPCFLKAC